MPSKVKGYTNTVTKYSSQVLTKSHPGVCGIGRLVHSSHNDGKVKQVHACKYLHLRSNHNALAKASKDYIKKSGDGLVQVNYFTDLICLCFFLISLRTYTYTYYFSSCVCLMYSTLILNLIFPWGSKKCNALAPLRSFLSAVDNVPPNYTAENFRD